VFAKAISVRTDRTIAGTALPGGTSFASFPARPEPSLPRASATSQPAPRVAVAAESSNPSPAQGCPVMCIGFVAGGEKLGIESGNRDDLIKMCMKGCEKDPGFLHCLALDSSTSFERCGGILGQPK